MVFRSDSSGELDRSGILVRNKEMFFKLYRHQLEMDVLDFNMRARLVIDWLGISRERYERTYFQRIKFNHLKDRITNIPKTIF